MDSTASGRVFVQIPIDIERPDSPQRKATGTSEFELSIGSNCGLENTGLESPDLSDAELTGAGLAGANLTGANLKRADLNECNEAKALDFFQFLPFNSVASPSVRR